MRNALTALALCAAFACGAYVMHYRDTAEANTVRLQAEKRYHDLEAADHKAAADAYKDLTNAKDANDALRRQLLAGTKRLYVKAVCPKSDGTRSMDDEATYAELDPAVASDLVGITDEGDEAIRQLNALQDKLERK